MQYLEKETQYTAKQPTATFLHLKQLIIIFLLAVGLVPGMFGLTTIYKMSQKELVTSKGLYFSEVASFTAFQVEKILDEQLEAIQRLASLPTTKNILTFPLGNTVKEIENLRKIIMPELARKYFVTTICNSDGETVFSSDIQSLVATRPLSSSDSKIQVAKSGKAYISDILEDTSQMDQYYIEINVPVKNEDGENIGSIQARYNLDKLFDTINSVQIGDTGHANLITSTGTIVVCPIFALKSHKINKELLETIAGSSGAGWSIADDDGHGTMGTIVGYSPINLRKEFLAPGSFGDKDWYIFTRQEPSETFQSIHKFQSAAIINAILLILLALGMGFFAWRQILRAQKAHQSEVIYKEKAESVKQLMASFQQLMSSPLEEFSNWLDNVENHTINNQVEPEKVEKFRQRLLGINSLMKHLAYYTQTETFKLQPVELEKIVTESLGLLDYMITKKEIEVRLDKPAESVVMMGDPRLLSIVIMNIVLNAIHAVDKGGKVHIHIENNGDWGTCKISDNGIGIPKGKIENIFDPFFTTKKGHKGYGMGLAVSRGIIEKHGGSIAVKSAEGEGTEIIIILALAKSLLNTRHLNE